MNWFDMVKKFYNGGFWAKQQVADAIRYGKITPEEYKEITGEDYTVATQLKHT